MRKIQQILYTRRNALRSAGQIEIETCGSVFNCTIANNVITNVFRLPNYLIMVVPDEMIKAGNIE